MKELVADARAGDMFVIYCRQDYHLCTSQLTLILMQDAGHSGQVQSLKDTHETDGLDEREWNLA